MRPTPCGLRSAIECFGGLRQEVSARKTFVDHTPHAEWKVFTVRFACSNASAGLLWRAGSARSRGFDSHVVRSAKSAPQRSRPVRRCLANPFVEHAKRPVIVLCLRSPLVLAFLFLPLLCVLCLSICDECLMGLQHVSARLRVRIPPGPLRASLKTHPLRTCSSTVERERVSLNLCRRRSTSSELCRSIARIAVECLQYSMDLTVRVRIPSCLGRNPCHVAQLDRASDVCCKLLVARDSCS